LQVLSVEPFLSEVSNLGMDLILLGGRASLLILRLVTIECFQHVGELLNLGLDRARQLSVGSGGDLHGLELALGLHILILKVKIFLCDLRDFTFYLTEMVGQGDDLEIIFRGSLLTFLVDWSCFGLFLGERLFLSNGCKKYIIILILLFCVGFFRLLGLGCFLNILGCFLDFLGCFLSVICLLNATCLLTCIIKFISTCWLILSFLLQSWFWLSFNLWCFDNGSWIALNLLWLDRLLAFFLFEVICGGDILNETKAISATGVSSDLWLWA
jgi:hypothetical protein